MRTLMGLASQRRFARQRGIEHRVPWTNQKGAGRATTALQIGRVNPGRGYARNQMIWITGPALGGPGLFEEIEGPLL